MKEENNNQAAEKVKEIAIAYARFSDEKQIGNNSIKNQLERIRNYAEELNYFIPLDYELKEEAVSAFSKEVSKRKVLLSVKQKVLANKEIKAIIFYDISRMDRTGYSFKNDFYEPIHRKRPDVKIFIASNKEEWDPMNWTTKFQLILAASESYEKSRRESDRQFNLLEKEKPIRPGSRAPYGYKFEDKSILVVDDETSPVVQLIYYLSVFGFSMEAISEKLNNANLLSPSKKKWNGSTIENILKNKVYLGHLIWKLKSTYYEKKYDYIGNHEIVIPLYLYKFVQVNNFFKKKYGGMDTPFLFAGLIICKGCCKKMEHRNQSTTKKKNGKKYTSQQYRCKNCKNYIDINEVHDLLLQTISEHIQKQAGDLEKVLKVTIKTTLSTLEQHQKVLKEKVETAKLNQNFCSNIEDDGNKLQLIVEKVLNKFVNELTLLKQQIDFYKQLSEDQTFKEFIKNFYPIDLSKLGNTELRSIICFLVKEIVIEEKSIKKIEFHENPLIHLQNEVG